MTLKSFPILDYNYKNCFLEIRRMKLNEYETFEIIFWDYIDKNSDKYTNIGYWELDGCYKFRMNDSSFLKVDSIVLNKIIRDGQKILDCYLGEIKRLECL